MREEVWVDGERQEEPGEARGKPGEWAEWRVMSLRNSQKGLQQGQTLVRRMEEAICELGESDFSDGEPGRCEKLVREGERGVGQQVQTTLSRGFALREAKPWGRRGVQFLSVR